MELKELQLEKLNPIGKDGKAINQKEKDRLLKLIEDAVEGKFVIGLESETIIFLLKLTNFAPKFEVCDVDAEEEVWKATANMVASTIMVCLIEVKPNSKIFDLQVCDQPGLDALYISLGINNHIDKKIRLNVLYL